MSAFSRSSGASRRGFSTVFATVLALLLSALGGIRLGLDRLVRAAEDDAPVVACQASLHAGLRAETAGEAANVAITAVTAPLAAAVPMAAGSWPLLARVDVPAPSPLLGSAGGPRAP
jgi:hypothetical protein